MTNTVAYLDHSIFCEWQDLTSVEPSRAYIYVFVSACFGPVWLTHLLRLCQDLSYWDKKCNDCLNTNIYYYLGTFGSQSSNLYSNVAYFSTTVLVRHLWLLKTVVLLHWHLIRAVLGVRQELYLEFIVAMLRSFFRPPSLARVFSPRIQLFA